MLGDSILVIIGLLLIALGVQPMLQVENRKNSVNVVNSVALAVMGLFIIFYWNSIVPA